MLYGSSVSAAWEPPQLGRLGAGERKIRNSKWQIASQKRKSIPHPALSPVGKGFSWHRKYGCLKNGSLVSAAWEPPQLGRLGAGERKIMNSKWQIASQKRKSIPHHALSPVGKRFSWHPKYACFGMQRTHASASKDRMLKN